MKWAVSAASATICVELAACGFVLPVRIASSAQISLGEIYVEGYQKAGQSNDAEPGTTNSSAIYVGPAIGNRDLADRIRGPRVTVTIFRHPSPHVVILPTDNTVWIGRGSAPQNCGMLIYAYRRGKSPDARWNVNAAELAQARKGKLAIYEITVGCGRG